MRGSVPGFVCALFGFGFRALSAADYDVWYPREVASGQPATVNTVVYGNGVFVTCPSILTSTDGLVWKSSGQPDIQWIAFLQGEFWGTTWNGRVKVSANGVDWSVREVPAAPMSRVVFGKGRYVFLSAKASGIHGVIPLSVSSTDGSHWTVSEFQVSPIGSAYQLLAYGGGTFVAYTLDRRPAVSSDGISWNQIPASEASPAVHPGAALASVRSTALERLEYRNGTFVHFNPPSFLESSVDGRKCTIPADTNVPVLFPVGVMDGARVSLASNGDLLVSTDGANWIRRPAVPALGTVADFAFSDRAFVALSSRGGIRQAGGLRNLPCSLPMVWPELGGGWRVFVESPIAREAIVEFSDDLLHWTELARTANPTGLTNVFDAGVPADRGRFYRARLP